MSLSPYIGLPWYEADYSQAEGDSEIGVADDCGRQTSCLNQRQSTSVESNERLETTCMIEKVTEAVFGHVDEAPEKIQIGCLQYTVYQPIPGPTSLNRFSAETVYASDTARSTASHRQDVRGVRVPHSYESLRKLTRTRTSRSKFGVRTAAKIRVACTYRGCNK